MSSDEKLLYSEDEMRRAITRMAHEILERNAGARDLVLVGLRTRGCPLARRLAAKIGELEQVEIPVAELDITAHRDDRKERTRTRSEPSDPLPVTVEGRVIDRKSVG